MNIEPCMFCGGEAVCSYCHSVQFYFVQCEDITCQGTGPNEDTEEQAITAWNDVARIVREHRESNDRA